MPCTDAQRGHGQDCGYSFKGKLQRDKILSGYFYTEETTKQKDLEIWWGGSNEVYNNSKQTIFDMIPILTVQ